MKKSVAKCLEVLLPSSAYLVPDPEPVSSKALDDFERAIKDYFLRFFSPDFVQTHWELPTDYQEFLRLGIRMTLLGEGEPEEDIYTIDQTLKATTQPWYEFEMAELEKRGKAGKLSKFDTLWLNIGWWGDKHEYFICCDRSHECFGQVVDCHDDTPWGSSYFSDSFDSFVDFLEALLKDEEE